MTLYRWLQVFLRLNILAGALACAGLALYPLVAGPAGDLNLNLAVAALFYSYLFWLAEIFSRPVATDREPAGPRSGSV